MTRRAAAAGSALFLVLAPGMAAGLVPWLITDRDAGSPPLVAQVGSPALLARAAAFMAVVVAFVRLCEEPVLRARYGAEYESYRRAVPGWWPRRPRARS